MGEITKLCAGCTRLTNGNDPLCRSCCNQSNYKARGLADLGIDREMKMLAYNPPRRTFHELAKDILGIDTVPNWKYVQIPRTIPDIKDVIFHPPATIVYWADGTKTVVKVQDGEFFDPEKGLAMAYWKKTAGNTGSYFNEIKKWTAKYNPPSIYPEIPNIRIDTSRFKEAIDQAFAGIKHSISIREDK